jgi:hypothetical protein
LQEKRCDKSNGMDLTGQLSNPPEPLARLLSILSRLTKRTKKRSTKPKRSGYIEGRRRFGSVGKTVLEVLASADSALTAHEIRLRAEKLLGGPVSRHSIAYQLRTRSKGSEPAIIQTGLGYYRLAELA